MSTSALPHKPLAISLGDPAGIGPDIFLKLCSNLPHNNLCIYADIDMLRARATQLGMNFKQLTNNLLFKHIPLSAPCTPGKPDSQNSTAIIQALQHASQDCLSGHCSGLVTAPISKAVINEAGIPFSGHTEWLADFTQTKHVVMMLANTQLRVALVTTHLPLSAVCEHITQDRLNNVLDVLITGLCSQFSCKKPRIIVCGLNPHAGENGYLGHEEINIIQPALSAYPNDHCELIGPLPADTAFLPEQLAQTDCVLAMYHDQGLPVLKSHGFNQAVNITLGLPFLRTSVDHGTAFHLAGTLAPSAESLHAAIAIHTKSHLHVKT